MMLHAWSLKFLSGLPMTPAGRGGAGHPMTKLETPGEGCMYARRLSKGMQHSGAALVGFPGDVSFVAPDPISAHFEDFEAD
jgi:hypothetical protein